MARYRLGHDYREEAVLADGTPVVFRLVRPEDAGLLLRGFERLSPESRYRRFFTAKAALSSEEVRYLTDVDGVNHFAVGAVRPLPGGAEEGLGIARFVRFPDEPEVAEPAVAVTDDYQRRGLGRQLLDRLVTAAVERGIRRFRCQVLVDNPAIVALLRDLTTAVIAEGEADGEVATVEVTLPSRRAATVELLDRTRGALAHMLAVAAQGRLVLVSRLGKPSGPRDEG